MPETSPALSCRLNFHSSGNSSPSFGVTMVFRLKALEFTKIDCIRSIKTYKSQTLLGGTLVLLVEICPPKLYDHLQM